MTDLRSLEDGFFQEYLKQGYEPKRARHYAHQRALRNIVKVLKTQDPATYARLQQTVAQHQAEAAAEDARRQEAQRIAWERERDEVQRMSRFKSALIPTGVCLPNLDNVLLPTFRAWKIDDNGWLRSVAQHSYVWREVSVADRVPEKTNTSGLYSIRPDPVGLVQSINSYLGGSECCGIVSLGGKVVEHIDGWMRAEFARIVCIWYVKSDAEAYIDIPLLMKHYPTTPIFVCTVRQVCEALCMVLVYTARRR